MSHSRETQETEAKEEAMPESISRLDDHLFFAAQAGRKITFTCWDAKNDVVRKISCENKSLKTDAWDQILQLDHLKVVQESTENLVVLNGGSAATLKHLIRIGSDGSLTFSEEKFTSAEVFQGHIYASKLSDEIFRLDSSSFQTTRYKLSRSHAPNWCINSVEKEILTLGGAAICKLPISDFDKTPEERAMRDAKLMMTGKKPKSIDTLEIASQNFQLVGNYVFYSAYKKQGRERSNGSFPPDHSIIVNLTICVKGLLPGVKLKNVHAIDAEKFLCIVEPLRYGHPYHHSEKKPSTKPESSLSNPDDYGLKTFEIKDLATSAFVLQRVTLPEITDTAVSLIMAAEKVAITFQREKGGRYIRFFDKNLKPISSPLDKKQDALPGLTTAVIDKSTTEKVVPESGPSSPKP